MGLLDEGRARRGPRSPRQPRSAGRRERGSVVIVVVVPVALWAFEDAAADVVPEVVFPHHFYHLATPRLLQERLVGQHVGSVARRLHRLHVALLHTMRVWRIVFVEFRVYMRRKRMFRCLLSQPFMERRIHRTQIPIYNVAGISENKPNRRKITSLIFCR